MKRTSKTAIASHVSALFSRKILPLSILAASGAFASTTAIAADKEAKKDIEHILVTGSRRNDRTVSESSVPVDIINIEDMVTTGQLEVSQVLTTLIPSFNYPNPSIADGTDHSRPAVLRGLAPDHTLVLINGKRRHSSALLNLNGTVGRGSTAVDLNTIPTSAIKSIEVLRDGAAAQYGSDAIAGVINIILKDETGGSISATYGEYNTTMAGVPQLESVSVGADGNLAFETGGDRTRTDGGITTIAGDWGTEIGEAGFFNVAFESRQRDPSIRSGFDPREQYARIDDGSENGALDPRELSFDRYNHKWGKAKVEDLSLFFNMGYNLSETTEIYAFGSFSEREGLSAGFYRRAKDSRNVLDIYPNGFLPHISSDVTDTAFNVGIKGETNDWNWDLSANIGKNDFGFGVENSLNTSLGKDSPTEFDNGNLVYEQIVTNASANTMQDWGLENEVFVALGFEYRQENYQIKPGEEASYVTKLDGEGDPIAAGGAQVLPGFSPSSAVDDSRHNYAVYVELDTDVNDRFNIAYAGRFEDYSDFGSTFTNKLAGRFSVNDELSFRGAISTGFRAPSLAQTSYKSIATVFVDGVPNEVGLFPVDEPAAVALGAKQLEAEESVNSTFGFVYEYDDFNLTVDAYHITIDDRIVLSENLSGDAVVDILKSAGELNTTRARYFTNAIDTTTKGLDIVATYDMDMDDYGSLRLSAALNFNDTEVTGIKDNPSELSALGDSYQVFSDREITRFELGTPKNKYNLAAMWTYEDLKVNLRATRYGEVVDASSNPDNHEVLAPKWITDIDASYQITESINLAIGVNNLFDQYPQDTVSNVGYSTFNQVFPYSGFSAYGADGRFVYARATYKF
ncbi:TonB-dependent receptor [Psychrobium sp. MM17-31]|uniref:TonB-dependent receptor plug domain-containing protein n=1 Tax=Psychrobium sp. MM17-31 TaxID=2917758 RepID=UPI001EF691E6|nr:TonB-dependent receptor [Psychrobium sp. MM17-31]MCG7533114.1 TonB-dependent receptor [Psychrobium sp. MM17-31]